MQKLERLDELRNEQQMEALVQLEQLFREMLEKQKVASATTLALDEKRNGQDGRLRRADRIELRTAEATERELSESAAEAEGMLLSDGTSVVRSRAVSRAAKISAWSGKTNRISAGTP